MSSIPKGYKKTEVGIIPDEWEFCCIVDKQILNESSIQTGPFGTLLKASEYTSTGIPVISVREIRDGYILIFDETPFIGVHTCKRLPQFILEEGDIVFARKGGVDRSAIVREKYGTLYLGSDGIRLRFKKENPEYLAFWFHSGLFKKELLQNATGTIMANMSQEIMSHLPLLLPPPPEQKAIAEVLSDMDALIEAQKELIAKKRDIKQGTMQDLLSGRVRLPGYETKGWKHTDIGDIPDDWEVKKLESICELLNGYAFKAKNYSINGSFKVITITNIQRGFFTTSCVNYISFLPIDIQKHQILDIGDILISMTGTIVGHIARVNEINCLLNQRVGKLKFNKNLDTNFIYSVLNRIEFETCMTSIAAGGAQVNLNKNDILSYQVSLPPLPEQQAIAQVLSDMDDELATLEAELEKLNHMKRGMMQELLTGRIRLI